MAGEKLNIALHYADTAPRFGPFLREPEAGRPAVQTSVEEIAKMQRAIPEAVPISVIEYNTLLYTVAKELLERGIVILHGLGFIWRGKAWIFAAPSGTGKTTQYIRWKLQYRDEIRMLNGDKVALKPENGRVRVYPTPWPGKECMSRMEDAELGGVIFLKQGAENRIERLSREEAKPLLCRQFVLSECDLRRTDVLDRVRDAVLDTAELWKLSNLGDVASARLTHDTILSAAEG